MAAACPAESTAVALGKRPVVIQSNGFTMLGEEMQIRDTDKSTPHTQWYRLSRNGIGSTSGTNAWLLSSKTMGLGTDNGTSGDRQSTPGFKNAGLSEGETAMLVLLVSHNLINFWTCLLSRRGSVDA